MAEPYQVPADGTDVFRTFVMPIPVAAARYVRAVEFHPGNARVVHHANLGVDRTRSSRQLDARDPEPGYAGSMERDARYPEGQLLGWTPGQAPHPAPDGTQWRLEPGSDLVVQLHFQPTGKVGARGRDRRLLLHRRARRRARRSACGWEARRSRSRRARASTSSPIVISCRSTSRCWPSSRTRTTSRAGWKRRRSCPTAPARWLIAIDDWDFRWQDVYRYAAPLALPKGTTLSMRYVYDNSAGNPRNPHRPPARVVWGQNTSDEMGDLWLQVIPRAVADEPILTADFRRKAHTEDLAAYTKLLQQDPANPLRHDAVASLYLRCRA